MEQKRNLQSDLQAASHLKRQRVATEKLYYFAAENKVPIVIGSIAQPLRITMEIEHGRRAGFNLYVILSSDETLLLTYDFVTGEMRILPNDEDKKITPMAVVANMERNLKNSVLMDGEFMPTRWYVLEPLLVSGDLFDAQRKRTKLLQNYADTAGIAYSQKHRAKLAEVHGETCWSLYCKRTSTLSST